MPRSTSLPLLGAALALAMASLPALAQNVPTISGHMTDPGRKLSDTAKSSIEDKLTKVAEDTHIDVAGWISDVPEAQADTMGAAFYRRWNIGGEWDSGVFFMFPASGRVHVILEPGHPKLTSQETAQLLAADDPARPLPDRIGTLIDETRKLIVPKALRVRPWGTNRPAQGLRYALAALAVALTAMARSLLRRRAEEARPEAAAAPATPRDKSAAAPVGDDGLDDLG